MARKWPRTHVDEPGALPYKPRQSRRLAGGPERLRPLTSLKFSVRSGDQPRETDLSAEQIGAQAPPRLSYPDGDQGRPQGFVGASRPRPQAAERLSRKKPAQVGLTMERLKRRTDFRAITEAGAR